MDEYTKTQRIDDLKKRFAAGARISFKRIVNDYGVSKKTASRDIENLQQMGMNLDKDSSANEILWYALPDSRTIDVHYSISDVLTLFAARRLFDFLENTSLEMALNRVYSRIESKLAATKDIHNAQKLSNKVYLIHEGPKKLNSNSSEILDECLTGLLLERKLKISYRNAKGKLERFTVCPYTLTVYKRGLYLVASCMQKEGAVRTYALERITRAGWQKNEPFDYPTQWNPQAHFKDAFCIVPGPTQKVVLHFTAQTKRYIKIRAFHSSQKVKTLKDGTIQMRLQVPVNFELVNWLLSFGPHVQVISPEQLRKDIAGQLQAALSQYAAEVGFAAIDSTGSSAFRDTQTMDMFYDLEH